MQSETNVLSQSLHDLGLAAWFGGVLMGATASNRAAGDVDDPTIVARVTNGIWRRWWPANAVAIGAHLIGAVGLLSANRGRIAGQRGTATVTASRT